MKPPVLHSALFALLGLLLSPMADAYLPCLRQQAGASPSPADSVHFSCQIIDPEEWERDQPLPAAKRLQDLNVGEPRTVRLFYFLPNDRPYRAEVVAAMKTGMVELQTFFADQMEAHGHGRKTFQFEADDQGEPVVHRVDGDYADRDYTDSTKGEIARAYDNSANIAFLVMDISKRSAHGRAAGEKGWGWVIVYGGWDGLPQPMNWDMPSDWSTISAIEPISCHMDVRIGCLPGYLRAPPNILLSIPISIPISQLKKGRRQPSNSCHRLSISRDQRVCRSV